MGKFVMILLAISLSVFQLNFALKKKAGGGLDLKSAGPGPGNPKVPGTMYLVILATQNQMR